MTNLDPLGDYSTDENPFDHVQTQFEFSPYIRDRDDTPDNMPGGLGPSGQSQPVQSDNGLYLGDAFDESWAPLVEEELS